MKERPINLPPWNAAAEPRRMVREDGLVARAGQMFARRMDVTKPRVAAATGAGPPDTAAAVGGVTKPRGSAAAAAAVAGPCDMRCYCSRTWCGEAAGCCICSAWCCRCRSRSWTLWRCRSCTWCGEVTSECCSCCSGRRSVRCGSRSCLFASSEGVVQHLFWNHIDHFGDKEREGRR